MDIITLIWNNRADSAVTLQKSVWTGIQFLRSQLLNYRNFPITEYKLWKILKVRKPHIFWRLNPFNFIKNPNIEFFRKIWNIFKEIPNRTLTRSNLIFVFGHTHVSEIKEFYIDREMGKNLCYNTGAWCSWHKKLKPDSCLFTIDKEGPKLWKYSYLKEIVEKLAPF